MSERTYTQDEVRDLLAQHDARYRRELEAFTEQLDPLLFQLDALVAEVRALAEAEQPTYQRPGTEGYRP